MAFAAPGHADDLPQDVLDAWNAEILSQYQRLEPDYGSRFFSLDPPEDVESTVPVGWFGNPAEPEFCISPAVAQQLSDWGVRGRRALHNEYCEYAVVTATDDTGRLRPKRVQVTTELPEYYLTLATHAPDVLREVVGDLIGSEPRWQELYGSRVTDPARLTAQQRRVRFARQLTGHCGAGDLVQAGVPADPVGSLNSANALFMAHPINGLDDLLYIVMFGAHPYARERDGQLEQASRDDIFVASGTDHLACRHADPAAALAAAGAAFEGRTVAFADPLGVAIQNFAAGVFQYDGGPVPSEWVRLGRGVQGRYQRLEFGPGDDDPQFLDDLTVVEGDLEEPLTGGFQVVRQVQVGPFVAVGPRTPVADEEYVRLPPAQEIVCRDAAVCRSIRDLQREHEARDGAPPAAATGLRR